MSWLQRYFYQAKKRKNIYVVDMFFAWENRKETKDFIVLKTDYDVFHDQL